MFEIFKLRLSKKSLQILVKTSEQRKSDNPERFFKKRKTITLSLSSTWSGYVPKMNRMISSWFAMIDLCNGEWP